MENQEPFDLEAVYDAEIFPLMKQVIEICQKHNLPMFATFMYVSDDEQGEGFCTSTVLPKERPIPEKMLDLPQIMMSRRVRPLNIKVTKADGSVEMTTVLG